MTAASPEEAAFIATLEGRGRLSRYGAYLRRGGPGYLQSAMTLGGGTAASSLFAGRMFGYELLWVAPVGMLIGILLLGVLARLALEEQGRHPRVVRPERDRLDGHGEHRAVRGLVDGVVHEAQRSELERPSAVTRSPSTVQSRNR